MHKVFISYHHANDQYYKEQLLALNTQHRIFQDCSVDTGDINDGLGDEAIRALIRDYYLRDSTVTILLVGTETKSRKHVDWEIYSSMFDGKINKKSGILVVILPMVDFGYCYAPREIEKVIVYPDVTNWTFTDNRAEHERRFHYMPVRIIDNLMEKDAKISVVNWDRIISDPNNLSFLIDAAYSDRESCKYDLIRPMRRANS